MKDLITVITLTYNSKDLGPTIDSILKQDYPRIQYIISDDCSTNLNLSYWKDYIEKKKSKNIEEILILTSNKNQGIIRNLNKATKRASGKYVYLCSHDDQLFDEKVLSDWTEEFICTGADVICGKRAIYDENMLKFQGYAPTPKEIGYFSDTSQELFENLATHTNFIFGASTARTKESFEKYGYYDEKYKNIEDYPAMLKISRQGGKIKYFDRVVLKYRRGGISTTISEKYLADEDCVFENEILPYTIHPKDAVRNHEDFKLEARLNNKRIELIQKYGENSCVLMVYKIYTWLKYPVHKLREKIQ